MTRRAGCLIASGILLLALVPLGLILAVAGMGSSGTLAPAASSSGSQGMAAAGQTAGGPSAAANEKTAAGLARRYGWGSDQDKCLDWLWTRESGWRTTALNSSSGAYGIAQALGHLKGEITPVPWAFLSLNKAGYNYPDSAGNPPAGGNASAVPYAGTSDASAQISWGLSYIQSTYGSPCKAWAHEEANSWY